MRTLILLILALLLCAPALAEFAPDPVALASLDQLPVIDIRTDSGDEPTDEGLTPATLTRYTMQHGRLQEDTATIEIKVRGNTSKIFPKKSFRIQATQDIALADGLRTDDDWILNPMYTDTSKIRETLAYKLWAAMNSSGQQAASSAIAYAEVYVNGDYRGLYGVQERVDRKQVDANKRFDVLYKVTTNQRPTVQELLACQDPELCAAFEVTFAGSEVEDVWAPAAAYMAMLNNESLPIPAQLSLENVIDYGLFVMVTQAHDCHFKNQYLSCVLTPDGYVLYKLPWDLNNTFGDIFQLDREDINYTNYAVTDLIFDGVFQKLTDLNDPALNAAIQRRWQALRRDVLTHDGLMARANTLYDPLADAIERDSQRWPESGMGTGNAVNIRDLDDYFAKVLPLIDEWVLSLDVTKGD